MRKRKEEVFSRQLVSLKAFLGVIKIELKSLPQRYFEGVTIRYIPKNLPNNLIENANLCTSEWFLFHVKCGTTS